MTGCVKGSFRPISTRSAPVTYEAAMRPNHSAVGTSVLPPRMMMWISFTLCAVVNTIQRSNSRNCVQGDTRQPPPFDGSTGET